MNRPNSYKLLGIHYLLDFHFGQHVVVVFVLRMTHPQLQAHGYDIVQSIMVHAMAV